MITVAYVVLLIYLAQSRLNTLESVYVHLLTAQLDQAKMNCLLVLIILLTSRNAATFFIEERQLVLIDEIEPEEEDEGSDEKVKLTIFYGTQCPGCKKFFKEQLPRLFDSDNEGLYKYIDFELVPYVIQAEKVGDIYWSYICMHGYQECEESKIHSCTFNAISNTTDKDYVKDSLLFLICLMHSSNEIDVLPKCLKDYKLPVEKIKGCLANEDLVGKLMTANVERENNNDPPVVGVPLTELNNVKDEDAENDIVKAVCDHLKSKPKVCSKFSNGFNEKFQFNNINIIAV